MWHFTKNDPKTVQEETRRRLEFEAVDTDKSPLKLQELNSFRSVSSNSPTHSIPDYILSESSQDSDSETEESRAITACAFRRHVELAQHMVEAESPPHCSSMKDRSQKWIDSFTPVVVVPENSQSVCLEAPNDTRKELTPLPVPSSLTSACLPCTLKSISTDALEAESAALSSCVAVVVALVDKVVTGTDQKDADAGIRNENSQAEETVDAAPLPEVTQPQKNDTVILLPHDDAKEKVQTAAGDDAKEKDRQRRLQKKASKKRSKRKDAPYTFGGLLPLTMDEYSAVEQEALTMMEMTHERSAAHVWKVGDAAEATYDGSISSVVLTSVGQLEDDDGVIRKCFFAQWPKKKDTLNAIKFPLFPEQLRVPVTATVQLPDFGRSRHARIKSILSADRWLLGKKFIAVDWDVHELLVNDSKLKLITDTDHNVFSYVRIASASDKVPLSLLRPQLSRHLQQVEHSKAIEVGGNIGNFLLENQTPPSTKLSAASSTKLTLPDESFDVYELPQQQKATRSRKKLRSCDEEPFMTQQNSQYQGGVVLGQNEVGEVDMRHIENDVQPLPGEKAVACEISNEGQQVPRNTDSGQSTSSQEPGAQPVSMNSHYVDELIRLIKKPAMKDEATATEAVEFTIELPPHENHMVVNAVLSDGGLQIYVPVDYQLDNATVAAPHYEVAETDVPMAATDDGVALLQDKFEEETVDGVWGENPSLAAINSSSFSDDGLRYLCQTPYEEPEGPSTDTEWPDFLLDVPATVGGSLVSGGAIKGAFGGESPLAEDILKSRSSSPEIVHEVKTDVQFDSLLLRQSKPMKQTKIVRRGCNVLSTASPAADFELGPQKRQNSYAGDGPPPLKKMKTQFQRNPSNLPPLPDTPVPLLPQTHRQTTPPDDTSGFDLPSQTPPLQKKNDDADGLTSDWTQPNQQQPFMFMRKKSKCNILMDRVHVTTEAREKAAKALGELDVDALKHDMSKEQLKQATNVLAKATRSFIAAIYGLRSNRVVLLPGDGPKMQRQNVAMAALIGMQPPPLKEALQHICDTCGLEKNVGVENCNSIINSIIDRMQGSARAAKRRSRKE